MGNQMIGLLLQGFPIAAQPVVPYVRFDFVVAYENEREADSSTLVTLECAAMADPTSLSFIIAARLANSREGHDLLAMDASAERVAHAWGSLRRRPS